jgi:hypothetical protein
MSITVSEAFTQLKSDLELTPTLQESISAHHTAIRGWIESSGSKIETKLIGSLQRNTRIQPKPRQDIFDIDVLVILGGFSSWVSHGGITPGDAMLKVTNIVSQNETYKEMGPETDSPAVIMEYADNIKVELIPAYIDNIGYSPSGIQTPPLGRGYWVPKNNTWTIADYDYDAYYMSSLNQQCNGYLIPTIKMLKAIKRNYFPDMKSYHLEALSMAKLPSVILNWLKQKKEISQPFLVYSFFFLAKDSILLPQSIPGSKTVSADSYMALAQKQQLSATFSKISAYCKNALERTDAEALGLWKKLFGDPFPSGG